MQFILQKAIKGQAMTDFLVDHPVSGSSKLNDDFPDEIAKICMTQTSFEKQVWQLLFDDALRTSPRGNIVAGVEVVLISLHNYVIPHAFLLTEQYSNNVVVDTPKRQTPRHLFNRSEQYPTCQYL